LNPWQFLEKQGPGKGGLDENALPALGTAICERDPSASADKSDPHP
jgi:hypothetical protein